MSKTRGTGVRSRQLGVAATIASLAVAGLPAVAHAQGSNFLAEPPVTGNSSVDNLIGQLPDEIVIGGPVLTGSEGLEAVGSSVIPETALSVGEVVGSMALTEAIGISGGSAAGSLALSGSVAGSAYANPTGSVGSGVITLGSLVIPEYVIPMIALQLSGLFISGLAQRQEAGQLTPEEVDFWHGVVEGSAAGGAALEEAAAAAGVALPDPLVGSIDTVQIAAAEDPHAQNELMRQQAEAAAAAPQPETPAAP